MNIFQESGESILRQRSPSPPGSAGLTHLESIKQLLWPGACPYSSSSSSSSFSSPPSSSDLPSYLGTFEELPPPRIPEIVITDAEQEGAKKQQEQEDSDDSISSSSSSSSSNETLISPYTDSEDSDSDSDSDFEGGEARSRWSETSSSDDDESDYGSDSYSSNNSNSDRKGDARVLVSFPALGGKSMMVVKSTILEETDEEKAAADEKDEEGREEEETAIEEAVGDHENDETVDSVEEEYGRPWGPAVPRWKWLQSSDSLPMYGLGPRDFHHGHSKLTRASSPEDSDSDSDSDCEMVSPISTGCFDTDAQMVDVVAMEGVQWLD